MNTSLVTASKRSGIYHDQSSTLSRLGGSVEATARSEHASGWLSTRTNMSISLGLASGLPSGTQTSISQHEI